MRNKFLILLGILFFLSGCRPVGVTVYLFPDTKESAKVRNYLFGTIYTFQREWILGCKYFARSIEFGKSEMLFRWLGACENFEFKEILR
ncbi:hypothetical protein CH371_09740 [Leptospira wolffii]|uniref:Lipoprotein n=1 Tax=Leptospira wolffii TaxID=409998 RepID=A0A2M9ZBR7_9LEPT|nr:hypothetical protein [Leptospira wolffii]PJZ65822.1 hypothetical protein CH371_09740 [Leptospira wolffii]